MRSPANWICENPRGECSGKLGNHGSRRLEPGEKAGKPHTTATQFAEDAGADAIQKVQTSLTRFAQAPRIDVLEMKILHAAPKVADGFHWIAAAVDVMSRIEAQPQVSQLEQPRNSPGVST
jgi:hypothetical protein